VVPLAHVSTARPAARIATEAARFTAQVRLTSAGGAASATSAVSMMALGVGKGEALTVTAAGADAEAAVAAIVEFDRPRPGAFMRRPIPCPPRRRFRRPIGRFSPGHGGGTAGRPWTRHRRRHHLIPPQIEVAEASRGVAQESVSLAAAVAAVRAA